MLLYTLLAVVVIGVLFAIAVLVLPSGSALAESTRDELPAATLPTQPMRGADVATTRLPVALRGYRFAETDLLLDRLAEELKARDAKIAQLESALVGIAPSVGEFADYSRPVVSAITIDTTEDMIEVELDEIEQPLFPTDDTSPGRHSDQSE